MGRVGKLKKKSTSVNSRAARRGASPSDKSLESVPRAEAPTAVLAAHTSAGVSKKKSKAKPLSRAQRLRQQKGVERAEMFIDQLENKVAKSIGKAKTINARKAQWEDLNGKKDNIKILQQEPEGDDGQMEEDTNMAAPRSPAKAEALPTSAENSLPPAGYEAVDDDDNIS